MLKRLRLGAILNGSIETIDEPLTLHGVGSQESSSRLWAVGTNCLQAEQRFFPRAMEQVSDGGCGASEARRDRAEIASNWPQAEAYYHTAKQEREASFHATAVDDIIYRVRAACKHLIKGKPVTQPPSSRPIGLFDKFRLQLLRHDSFMWKIQPWRAQTLSLFNMSDAAGDTSIT